MMLTQEAPHPFLLYGLVSQIKYKPDWAFKLEDVDRGQGSKGLTLIITVFGPDSYNPTTTRGVMHYMIVPAAAFDERAWIRWLLDQILLVETHEACEFFKIDGNRPFSPNHGPGRNPYSIIEKGTLNDAKANAT